MLSATSLLFETDVITISNRTVKHTSWIRNKMESPWFCKCPFDCPPLSIFIPGSTSRNRFLTILVACNSKKNVLERFEVLCFESELFSPQNKRNSMHRSHLNIDWTTTSDSFIRMKDVYIINSMKVNSKDGLL